MRDAHFQAWSSSAGLSSINATFKNEQTALSIRQFLQIDQACHRQDPTMAHKLIASCLIKSTLSSNDSQIQKVLFGSRMEHFLMQPTSGGPSGPSVAQNYCVFTAKVGLRSQKPSPFQGVAEAPQEAPKRPSRGRQDKKLPRDPPPGTPPGPSTEAPRWPHLSPQWPSTRPCKDPRSLNDQEFNQIFQTRSTPQ